jgi:hypothetical protein
MFQSTILLGFIMLRNKQANNVRWCFMGSDIMWPLAWTMGHYNFSEMVDYLFTNKQIYKYISSQPNNNHVLI